MAGIYVHLDVPYCSAQKFADMTGLSIDNVKSKIARGQIPVIKVGRTPMVNLALLTKEAMEAESYREQAR